ncbi:hypothetical protein BJV82DRAFT_619365 [Fennellomyces sp. T-0311]|nr:hypothetical protein BJV82DRAFT_619365 [Fennellomyces sp. T-0311]
MPLVIQKSKKVNSETSAATARQEQIKAAAAGGVSPKFVQDPMRNTNAPDVLGGFVDPVSGRSTYTQGRDPTHTGAASTFAHDPVRNQKVPDVLGGFIDPMGARPTFTQGKDPTDTGA